MAVQTPYEYPWSSGTGFFRNGEKFLSPSPVLSPVPNGTWYFSKKMQLRGGPYTMKLYVDDATTVWFGPDFASAAMYVSAHINDGEQSLDIFLQPGLQRMDFILQNLGAGECGFVMSLWQGGRLIYAASSAEGWVFDTQPIPDEDVPPIGDPRRLMPVFSIMPNWEGGVLERLSFLSDVLESETGAEQRRALRVHPRREFEADFLRQGPQRSMLDTFLVGVGQDELLVPLWHEAITMSEGVEVGASGVVLSTDDMAEREFRQGDLAFVNAGDPNVFDILQVGEVFDNRFSWLTLPERAWPAGTRVFPLRVARITESTPMDNVSERVATTTIRFSLKEAYVLESSWGELVEGQPFFGFRPNRSTSLNTTISRLANVQDNSVGVPAITDIAENSATLTTMTFAFFGREKVYQYRRFLMAAMGRARSFYAPTFADDIEPLYPVIEAGSYLVAKPMGAGRFFTRNQTSRGYIGITLAGQQLPSIVRKIVAIEKQYTDQFGLDVDYQTNYWYDRFLLGAPIPELQASEVSRISFIAEGRFDQDSFDLTHRTNTSKAVTTSAGIRMIGNRRFADNSQPEQPDFPPIEPVPGGNIVLADSYWADTATPLAEVMFTLRADGKVEIKRASNGQIITPGIWCSPTREANLYEVRVSQTGGNGVLRLGDLNSWLRTSTTRSWALRAEATEEDVDLDAQLTFEFRDISTGTIRSTLVITLEAKAKVSYVI